MVIQNHGEFAYVGDATVNGNRITLSETEAHHLTRVRRARVGEKVMATDGKGCVYLCNLVSADTLEIVESYKEVGEPQLSITLVCGCLQGDTARDVVSSTVQLGARNLWWVKMARSQEQYSENKIEKLERVAIQATKQTGRARLIIQTQFSSLHEVIAQVSSSCLWVAHPNENADSAMYKVDSAIPHIIFVGPEGGFVERELEQLNSSNARFIRLGSRRLRTEAAAAASLMYLLTKGNDL